MKGFVVVLINVMMMKFSNVVAEDDDEVTAIGLVESDPSRKWRTMKRKLQSEFEDSGLADIDFEDDTYRDFSPGFRGKQNGT